MGPYYIPPSAIDGKTPQHCSWYAPGASGGVNIDGGAAVDPETGLLYVASQSGLSTTEVGKDPCSEHGYTQAGADGRATAAASSARRRRRRATCRRRAARRPERWRSGGGGRGGGAARRATRRVARHVGDRGHLDPEAARARRHHGVQHEHRRQGVVDSERRPDDRPDAVNRRHPDAALFANVKLPPQPAGAARRRSSRRRRW